MSSVSTTSYNLIPARTVNGDSVIKIDVNGNGKADKTEPALVQKTADGWTPMESLEKSVDRFAMGDSVNYWTDSANTPHQGFAAGLLNVVLGQKQNGVIDDGEIGQANLTVQNRTVGARFQSAIGTEILVESGKATLHETNIGYKINGPMPNWTAVAAWKETYRADDHYWQIAR